MVSWLRESKRALWAATRLMIVFTVLLGVVYPLVVLGIGQAAFHSKANGSMVHDLNGRVIGSSLIGQSFSDAAGNPLPQYFQPRPSAVGYDARTSGGSNRGPDDPELVARITTLRTQIAEFNGVTLADVPPDAVTESGSGLDPDISLEYARIQINRVAKARGLSVDTVTSLVDQHTQRPDMGYAGTTRVNVLLLNLALDELK